LKFITITILNLLCLSVAQATFVQISSPDAGYISATTLIPIPGALGSTVGSLNNAFQSIDVAVFGQHAKVGSSWGTWSSPPDSETSTPDLICVAAIPCDSTTGSSNTFALTAAAAIFGFELEPQGFGTYAVSASFFNGATLLGTVTRNVSGTSGARLFAGQSDIPITSVQLAVDPAAGGYGVAQFRYALAVDDPGTSTPEPSTGVLFGLSAGLLGTCVFLKQKRGSVSH